MEKEMFDIEKFNVISDEENYYFFRSLKPGDVDDLEKGIIKDGENYQKLRTDRERIEIVIIIVMKDLLNLWVWRRMSLNLKKR